MKPQTFKLRLDVRRETSPEVRELLLFETTINFSHSSIVAQLQLKLDFKMRFMCAARAIKSSSSLTLRSAMACHRADGNASPE